MVDHPSRFAASAACGPQSETEPILTGFNDEPEEDDELIDDNGLAVAAALESEDAPRLVLTPTQKMPQQPLNYNSSRNKMMDEQIRSIIEENKAMAGHMKTQDDCVASAANQK